MILLLTVCSDGCCKYSTVLRVTVGCFHVVGVKSSPRCDISLFWCLFPSFICRNHPFLLQRFWQTIRGYTRREWLRRRLKAQPIWTLFPPPFLFWIIILWAQLTFLISLTPALISACPPLHHHHHPSPLLYVFLYSPRLYFKGDGEVIVFLTPIEVKTAQGRRQSLREKKEKGDLCQRGWSSARMEWVVAFDRVAGRAKLKKKEKKNDAKASRRGKSANKKGCICLISGRVKRKRRIIKWCNFDATLFYFPQTKTLFLFPLFITGAIVACDKWVQQALHCISAETQHWAKFFSKLIIFVFQEIDSSNQIRHCKEGGLRWKWAIKSHSSQTKA